MGAEKGRVSVKIHDCKQGSTEWLLLRCGIPTASEFGRLVTADWKIRAGEGPRNYVLEKVAEKFMGLPKEAGGSWSMGQGQILETHARPWYQFAYDTKITEVGFITTDDGRCGCSPDGLIGDEGGIEIKSPQAHTHLEYLLGGVAPKEYRAQIQGCMYVTGRAWWKFVSYSNHFPSLVLHVEREEAAQTAIASALERFYAEFDAAHAKLSDLMRASGRGD